MPTAIPVGRLPTGAGRLPALPIFGEAQPWRNQMNKFRIIIEFFEFTKASKKWWLAPILIVLIVLGALLVLAQGSSLAPFIYTLF
jgi:hypothetical protein